MSLLLQDILSLLWLSLKQQNTDASSIDEETYRFFQNSASKISVKKAVQATTPAKVSYKPMPKIVPPPPQAPPPQKVSVQIPLHTEEVEQPAETTSPEISMRKHENLLPKPVSFVPVDTFQTRKKILSLQNMPRMQDGCLYETPEKKSASWAFFSFPLPPQEEQFFNSVLQAVRERLQKKISLFSCLDPSFASNLTLSAADAEKLFFFIEPHNESTLKRLLEAIPAFSEIPPREVDPFLSLGSIQGNFLHLFFLTPTTTATPEMKARLWLALKKLAYSTATA